ncbi:cytochrome P450 [Gordonia pseudamarae]|jgi:cytochrome P450|uniref:Cytochrome P450 n=1 Tax=Gordonia pseudamarae TaxID=2831662 RepID=A0ABX6IDX2_9ACTN|nr:MULTISPECIES: cytochrome P450 [Gordonia]MBD0022359.1 cytochrome P450 [Gordonia sp. (in: high G+C Gram-positive bacteria)]QHN25060.1 cytochrome P450 [Gordonia pseudamarae]QHN33994.1 cytochrome P450 [Gordonia pseudamarae]
MTNAEAPARPYSTFDISSHSFWEKSFADREETFAKLRAADGLTWHEPTEALFPHEETGFWAVTRNADIRYVSAHADEFCSGRGVTLDAMPVEIQKATTFFLTMDAPEHTRYRRLISMAFTPKQVRKIDEQIKANAIRIVDDLIAALDGGEPIDFMDVVAKKLPMQTVSEMIGLPKDQHETVAAAAEAVFGTSDDEVGGNLEEKAVFLMMQLGVLTTAGVELAKDRRINPQDDLMTNIVQAEVDGHSLTDEEVGAFTVLLASAGNDTTKQTTAHAFKALLDHPDQLAWLRADVDGRIGGAVDEFVRWATPVMQFTRTATRDTELAGTPISEGDKVAIFYCSGNFDTETFENPGAFDLDRFPNQHVGFGGGGPHHCLGKQLAVLELKHLFTQLATRIPDVELVGEVEYTYSDFVHGVKRMTIRKR